MMEKIKINGQEERRLVASILADNGYFVRIIEIGDYSSEYFLEYYKE